MRRYLFSALLLASSFAAFAQDRFVPVERRLSASQLAEVGLSPAQLQALNRVLREAERAATGPTAAVAPPLRRCLPMCRHRQQCTWAWKKDRSMHAWSERSQAGSPARCSPLITASNGR